MEVGSQKQQPKTAEQLIRRNGELVQGLFSSLVWEEIVFPLFEESLASVSGRFTNGRFHKGELTRTKNNRDELAGYQMALEEFHNRLQDFILAKDQLDRKYKEESLETKSPIINPFVEENDET